MMRKLFNYRLVRDGIIKCIPILFVSLGLWADTDTLLQMSEPFLVDTTRTLVSVGGWPDMIYDGEQYFVVWGEHRAGAYEVFGLRIRKDGSLIDSVPIVIKAGNTWKGNAVVGSNGDIYLVVWEEELYEGDYYRIMGSRVTKDGVVLDPGGIDISRNGVSRTASVASDGEDFFVVWRDRRNGTNDIYGARVSKGGQVLDPEGVKIGSGVYVYSHCVAFADSFYFVVYYSRSQGDVVAKRVLSSTGEVIDSSGLWISDVVSPYKVIYDGNRFFIVGLSDWYPRGIRVNKNGVVIDSVPIDISSSSTGNGASVVFDGSDYAVLWGNKFIKVDTSGVVLDTTYKEIEGVGGYPNISYNGSNYFLLWQGVNGVRISTSGQVIDTIPIHYSYAGNEEDYPAVAYNGWEYLIAYSTDRGGGTWKDIYAILMDKYGEILSEPIPVCVDSGKQPDSRLRVSSAGGDFLVVWDDEGNIYGRIIKGDSSISDSKFIINTSEYSYNSQPSVASDGERYFVVWCSWSNLVGRFVGSNGVIGDIIRLMDTGWETHPEVIFDGSAYFIVYDTYDYPDSDVRCIRLSREGEWLSSGYIASNDNYQESRPEVGYNGKEYFVIWADYRNWDNTGTDIYGAWVSKECKVYQNIKVSSDTSLEYPRDAVRMGNDILVSWSRGNSIYGAVIGRDGDVSNPILLDTLPGAGGGFFSGGNENVFMVFTAFSSYPYCNRRVYGKFVREGDKDNLSLSGLEAYPNINRGNFQIRFNGWEKGRTDISMYDIMGRRIKEWDIDILKGINKVDIDVRDIKTGKYFIYVSNGKSRCSTPVIIIK